MNHVTHSTLCVAAASVAVSSALVVYSFSGRPGFEIAFVCFLAFFATHTFDAVCNVFDR